MAESTKAKMVESNRSKKWLSQTETKMGERAVAKMDECTVAMVKCTAARRAIAHTVEHRTVARTCASVGWLVGSGGCLVGLAGPLSPGDGLSDK
jgi:hypothetical protein